MSNDPVVEPTCVRPSDAMSVFRTRLFGLVAPTLGWVPSLRYLLRRERVLSELRRIAPGKLIEVGCGAGALLDDFSRSGFAVVGLETSAQARILAKSLAKAGEGAQVIVGEVSADWAGTMDVVAAFDVLEHIEDDVAAITEWCSWLRTDGHLILTVPAHRSRWTAGDEWAGHWRRYDRTDLLSLLRAQGLSIVHFECYGFPLANITEMLGATAYQRLIAARNEELSRDEATARSGIDRSKVATFFRFVNTVPGRLALRFFMSLQAVTVRTDWGSGYLVLAKKV